jgi:RNA polymerase sigma factor (TIGR02999 family)
MTIESSGNLTDLLGGVAAGDPGAREQLIGCVYQQLHDLAGRMMRRERPGKSWGATDLVHEAYLRLLKGTVLLPRLNEIPPAQRRAYFFGAAVRAMRRLLVEHARSPAINRVRRVPLDDVLDEFEKTQRVSMEDLDQALRDLEGFAPRECEVVLLRVFGGLSVKEAAAHLGVSVSTVEKDWRWARTWLYTRLRGDDHDA